VPACPYGQADMRGEKSMTHYGGYAAHGMLLERMFDLLDEDQMRQLMIRMIESRIKMKEHRIEMMQYKVETYKMAREMLQAGAKRK
jgi:hypothetical protein